MHEDLYATYLAVECLKVAVREELDRVLGPLVRRLGYRWRWEVLS